MKPFFEKVNNLPNKSYFLRRQMAPYLTMPFHYHPELELTYNSKNSGKRFIGNSVERMEEEDLIFIGQNLPHAFLSDDPFEKDPARAKADSIVFQFSFDLFQSSFSQMPEMNGLMQLMEKSKQGMRIYGDTRMQIIQQLKDLYHTDGVLSIVMILQILHKLSTTTEYQLLSSKGFIKEYHTPDFHRINVVYNYIVEHFREEIHLSDVAKVANMTETAFCRFFKKRTLKTLIQVVNGLRVTYACSLLKMDTYDVKFIAEEAGFKNLSNFNRQFKKITGYTPLAYLKEFKQR